MKINKINISAVICSNRSIIHTISSIPSEMEIIIEKNAKPLGKARNIGISRTTRDWILLMDDDISFTNAFLNFLLELGKEKRIIGLSGYYPSFLPIGRLLFFSKKTWKDIGYFDERAHGDETDWSIRGIEKGYQIVCLPRESVYHYPHTKIKPKSEFGNLFYLLRKHPKFPFYVLKLIVTKMKDSSYDEEYIK